MRSVPEITLLFLLSTLLLLSILFLEVLPQRSYHPEPVYAAVATDTFTTETEIDLPVHEAGEQLFKENCKSCHKIHEESVGPALYGVSSRRPRKWIYAFIQHPQRLINKKDTMAVNVYEKYQKAEMTSFPSLTHEDIDSILIYIESYKEYSGPCIR